ncbi:DNA polymerase III subunit delta' [Nicoliella spurrieriana]|uniref:DNA polymerase III subunit delta n=1 Tax=Nicoliella spurrieriana TaxID=2925830 RepID=A0A976X5I6_9LACO|nr:DNA polymerase III subunit delta' [Nicoliella spurrieriana]UQS86998.1 DNA polymerase III subunit delta' [Nicoliella spurrieriana]
MSTEQSVAKTVVSDAEFKQPQLVEHFARVVTNHDLTHAYLFNGESGSGKLAVALQVTMALFCEHPVNGRPCGQCNECIRIANRQHPDVLIVQPDGASIKIDQVRMLKAEFSKSAVEGNQKAFIINGADKMTTEAANSLLKFIEEPVGNVVSFLLTNNKSLVLPTIVSRTQLVDFPAIAPAVFSKELAQMGIDRNYFHLITMLTNNLQTVHEWFENDWFAKLQTAISQWFLQLNKHSPVAFTMVQTDIVPLINNQAAKAITIDMLIEVWRDVLDVKFNAVADAELSFPQIKDQIHQIAFKIPKMQLLEIIELVLKNNGALAANLNFQTILETTTLRVLEKLE